MDLDFSEFPASYRLSQGAIGLASCLALFARAIFRPNVPPLVSGIFGFALLSIVAVGLLSSVYVIIRYPFLSLVEPADGDQFTKHFGMHPIVYKILSCLAILVILFLMFTIVFLGINGERSILFLCYLAVTLAFLIFHAFFYTSVQYPTVATFLRSTVGLGVLLLPLYLPVILLGAIRCRRLLNQSIA